MMEANEVKTRVLARISRDPGAADFRLSLFISSLSHYRHDTTLRPFPPAFLRQDGNKEYKRLENVFNTIPNVDSIIKGTVTLSEESWELMDWILDDRNIQVSSASQDVFADIQSKTGPSSYPIKPQFIFQVDYPASGTSKFQELSDSHGLLMAYHGSRLENFHSILQNGLHCHLNKTSLFGEGTYLSSDAALCMVYSSYGPGWNHSVLGQKLSCVAVCEMIDHPGVKCQMKSTNNRTLPNRARAANSEGGDVPEKYFVVTNNELLRVKYILVFVEKTKTLSARFKNLWLFKYPLASMLIFYAVCLLMIGLTKSRYFQQTYKKYLGSSS